MTNCLDETCNRKHQCSREFDDCPDCGAQMACEGTLEYCLNYDCPSNNWVWCRRCNWYGPKREGCQCND